MAMDDFMKLQQQKDPSETQQVDVEIQNLETRLRSKRKQTAIIPSENQTDVSVIDNQVVVPPEKQGPKKKTRGLTNMFEVHARKWEDRVAIYCNDKGQPVGPSKAKDELSLFLGTIARDHNWAPLNYTDWHKVPNKDKIWEYVQSKYILPNIAKDWVLTTVDWFWRGWKCRLKKLHYYSYSNNSGRWTFRPLNVPEAHFKTLLAY